MTPLLVMTPWVLAATTLFLLAQVIVLGRRYRLLARGGSCTMRLRPDR